MRFKSITFRRRWKFVMRAFAVIKAQKYFVTFQITGLAKSYIINAEYGQQKKTRVASWSHCMQC